MLKRTFSYLPVGLRLLHDNTKALRRSACPSPPTMQHLSLERLDAGRDFFFAVGEARYVAVHENNVSSTT
jgi:hypothetical protein